MQASQIYPTKSVNTFTVRTEEKYYRYFNGRRFYVSKELCHTVYPERPDLSNTRHSIFILHSDASYRTQSVHSIRHAHVGHYHAER